MIYHVETWATQRECPDKAVKLFVKLDHEPSENELADLRAKVTGTFRVVYQEWATMHSERVSEGRHMAAIPPDRSRIDPSHLRALALYARGQGVGPIEGKTGRDPLSQTTLLTLRDAGYVKIDGGPDRGRITVTNDGHGALKE